MYTRMEFEKPKLGVAEKLISTIVNNLQINVKQLYVRYEDTVNSTVPFALVALLNSMEIYTCN